MLLKASLRDRAIILLALSSGMRIEGLAGLKHGDISTIEGFNGYRIVVYANSRKHRYVTFCTPEARQTLELYFKERESSGEILTENSPVFRLELQRVKPMVESSIRAAVNVCAESVGLRPHIDQYTRHKTAALHGFRKNVNTIFVKVGIHDHVIKKLLGWKGGLQDSYLRMDDIELLNDYKKAVPLLTISQEGNLKAENERLKIENAEIQQLRALVIKQQDELEKKLQGETKIMQQMNEIQKAFERVFPGISKEFGTKKEA